MSTLRVKNQQLFAGEKIFPCVVGKNGVTQNKREGDHCTPVGEFRLRECWYRADRMAPPQTQLPLRAIAPDDGWCDDPNDPNYNRPVKLPYPASCEKLWREDHLYDVMVPLGYNDDPVVPGRGSAIFLHIAPETGGTEGCVALRREDLLTVLAQASQETAIGIGAPLSRQPRTPPTR